jgi:signal transduction histidine kinase
VQGTPGSEDLERLRAQVQALSQRALLGRLLPGLAHELDNTTNLVYGNIDFVKRYLEGAIDLVVLHERGVTSDEDRAEIERVRGEIDLDYMREDATQLLQAIKSGAERTVSLLKDLKTLLRGANAREPTPLSPWVGIALRLCAPLFKHRIDVKHEMAPDVPAVHCRPGPICQVVMHLLLNAAEAIPQKGEVFVALRALEGGGIVVSVRDSGPGIPEGDRARIFEPFFTTKQAEGNLGLGLATAREIATEHGGELRLAGSTPGETTFVLELPGQAKT